MIFDLCIVSLINSVNMRIYQVAQDLLTFTLHWSFCSCVSHSSARLCSSVEWAEPSLSLHRALYVSLPVVLSFKALIFTHYSVNSIKERGLTFLYSTFTSRIVPVPRESTQVLEVKIKLGYDHCWRFNNISTRKGSAKFLSTKF